MSRKKGWYPDPTQRHEKRMWDGAEWTSTVYDAGIVAQDPDPLPSETDSDIGETVRRENTPSARIASLIGGSPPKRPGEVTNQHDRPDTDRPKTPTWKILLSVFGVMVAIILLGSIADDETTTYEAVDEANNDAVVPPTTTEPTTTTTTLATTTTTSLPRTDQERLSVAINEALGDSNRGVERFTVTMTELAAGITIDVEWAINEHFPLNDAAEIEATDILRAVRESGVEYHELWLHGSFSMTRPNGTTAEDVVVQVRYPRASVDQIEFDSFLFDNIFEIADQAAVHVEFQE